MSARIAVLASGGGTNLDALLRHFAHGAAAEAGRVALVLSDVADAGALERARRAGIEARHLPVRGRAEDEAAALLLEALQAAAIDVVALAGYLQLVPAAVVRAFRDRILNIHPSLLPAFGGRGLYGRRVHRAVLEAGCRVTGATVHYVDERYDSGPILAQWPVPVLPDDSPGTLAARVLRVEHRLFPPAVEAVARAAGRGGRPAPLQPLAPPLGFSLAGAEAPPARTVRRMLGLE